jgi:hypothetical protein
MFITRSNLEGHGLFGFKMLLPQAHAPARARS